MLVKSSNPFSNEIIKEFELDKTEKVLNKLEDLHKAQQQWSNKSIAQRIDCLSKINDVLLKSDLAKAMAQEMGKPLTQAKAELKKCCTLYDFYAQNAEEFLLDESIGNVKLRYQAKGIILAIMPWNFPVWQVFRCAIPALIAGNAVILKHSPLVWKCQALIQKVFDDCNLGNIFNALYINHEQSETIIASKHISHINFTGSVEGGKAVAKTAAKYLKPCVLELGGNNALILGENGNKALAINKLIEGRMANAGQSCIAPKRAFVPESIFTEFCDELYKKIMQYSVSNPIDNSCKLGPLADEKFAVKLALQIKKLEDKGVVVYGKKYIGKGASYHPQLLKFNLDNKHLIRNIELFGPVFSVIPYNSLSEVIQEINASDFALGASIFTNKLSEFENFSKEIKEAQVVQNDIVKSNAAIPFMGLKQSGYGSELGKDGLLEFVYRQALTFNH